MDYMWYWKRFESTGNVKDYIEYLKHINREDISEETDEDFCGWFGDMGEEDRGG